MNSNPDPGHRSAQPLALRPLHVTSPLQHGPDVLAIQERLLELGYEWDRIIELKDARSIN